MKTLTLSLKRKWFDMIKSGEKKEEYREIKPRYLEMFCKTLSGFEANHSNNFDVGFHLKWPEELGYDRLVFTLGYPKALWCAGSRNVLRNSTKRLDVSRVRAVLYSTIARLEILIVVLLSKNFSETRLGSTIYRLMRRNPRWRFANELEQDWRNW